MPHPADPAPVPADPAPVPADPAVPSDSTGHAAHDRVLVVAYASGDAEGAELEAATRLVADCAECAALHRDLRAIAAALPELPAPRRTRDFRLTSEQAASLRPAAWRRLLAPFAGPRFAFAAPLGSGLAALGIVGILLAGSGFPLAGATSGAAESGRSTANGTVAAPVPAAGAPSFAPVAPSPAAAAPAYATAAPSLAVPAAAAASAPAAPSPGDAVMAQGASVPPGVSSVNAGAADASANPQPMVSPAEQPAAASGAGQAVSGTGPGETAGTGAAGSATPLLLLASLVGLVAGVVLVALRFAGRSAVRTP